MAFVAPIATSTFVGTRPSTSICYTNIVKHVNERRQAYIPTMAFSSIDDASSEIFAEDNSIETGTLVIQNMYKQIFGNAYLMESEREELASFESAYKLDKINVKELARSFAKSNAYKKRFFERSGPYTFIELNYKHFLGRAPKSQSEISYHVQLLNNEGYDKEIDSYFDSNEYMEKFGVQIVPRFIFQGCYSSNDDFNKMCYLRRFWDGCSTSTISGSTAPTKPIKAQLILPPGSHIGNPVQIAHGIRTEHKIKDLQSVKDGYPIPANSYAPVKIRIQVAENSFTVFETDAYKSKDLIPSWKKEKLSNDTSRKLNGVWY